MSESLKQLHGQEKAVNKMEPHDNPAVVSHTLEPWRMEVDLCTLEPWRMEVDMCHGLLSHSTQLQRIMEAAQKRDVQRWKM